VKSYATAAESKVKLISTATIGGKPTSAEVSFTSRDGRWVSPTAKTIAQSAWLRILAIVGGWQDKEREEG